MLKLEEVTGIQGYASERGALDTLIRELRGTLGKQEVAIGS